MKSRQENEKTESQFISHEVLKQKRVSLRQFG